MTGDTDCERFQRGAAKYAAYLETPEGRLRLEVSFANLEEFLPQAGHSWTALDLGGGTGATAVRLARLGFHVTLLDSSSEMLEIAKLAATAEIATGKITLQLAEAGQVAELLRGNTFDVIVCHNLLEYVDDPVAVMRGVAGLLRDSSAILSVLVRNRAGEVLKTALQSGDLEAAGQQVSAQWGCESLYGGRVRLFTPDELLAISKEARLEMIAQRGVRVISDYLSPQIWRQTGYQRIFELERKLGSLPAFAAVARYWQCLFRRSAPILEAGV